MKTLDYLGIKIRNYKPVIARNGIIYIGKKFWKGAEYTHDTVALENNIDEIYVYGVIYEGEKIIKWLPWEEIENRFAYIENPLELWKTQYQYENQFKKVNK